MKLYRFTAANNHRAMLTVTKALGPNALVYATRKIPGGVEMLAGLPATEQVVNQEIMEEVTQSEIVDNHEIKIQEGLPENRILENLKLQIEEMHESISALSDNIASLQNTFTERLKKKHYFSWNSFKKLALFRMRISFSRSRSTN